MRARTFSRLAGDGRRLHGWSARQAGAPREVHRVRLHPRRHRHHHVPARPSQRIPVHPALHHPRRRHDGRQRHDRHRRHHEEAPGGRQDPEEPGQSVTSSPLTFVCIAAQLSYTHPCLSNSSLFCKDMARKSEAVTSETEHM